MSYTIDDYKDCLEKLLAWHDHMGGFESPPWDYAKRLLGRTTPTYSLTLTKSERDAIEWIGDRYAHGHDLFIALTNSESFANRPDTDEAEWDSDNDLTFNLQEHEAWAIKEIGEESEFLWDCFAPEFVEKLNAFCDSIV